MKTKSKKTFLRLFLILSFFLITALTVIGTAAYYAGNFKNSGKLNFDGGIFFEFRNVIDKNSNSFDGYLKHYENGDTSRDPVTLEVVANKNQEFLLATPQIIAGENSIPFYARLKISYEYYLIENGEYVQKTASALGATSSAINSELFSQYLTLNGSWFLSADGYYYYTEAGTNDLKIINPEEEIDIFTNLTLTTKAWNSIGAGPYGISKMKIKIAVDVVEQAALTWELPEVLTLQDVEYELDQVNKTIMFTKNVSNKREYAILPTYEVPTQTLSTGTETYTFVGLKGADEENGFDTLVTKIYLPETTTEIGDFAFAKNGKITALELPDGTERIGDKAFYSCSALIDLKISQSVTTIGNSSFAGCGFSSIYIPRNVSQIGTQIFSSCHNLTEVTVDSNNSKYRSVGNCIIDKTNLAAQVIVAGCSNSVIPTTSTVTKIGEGAFSGSVFMKTLTIPSNITEVAQNSFIMCSNLVFVEFADSVTSIGETVFYVCTSLKEVVVNKPYNTNSDYMKIGANLFAGCSALESIYVPSSSVNSYKAAPNWSTYAHLIKALESRTGTAGLVYTPVDNSGNVVTEGSAQHTAYMVSGYTGEDSVVYILAQHNSKPVIKIGSEAFKNNAVITDVVLGNNIKSIGASAFEGCTQLKAINMPNNLTTIESFAFKNCSSLLNIAIPSGVTSIGTNPYLGCTGVGAITIESPNFTLSGGCIIGSSTLISGFAFSTIPTTGVTSIGASAFEGQTNLTTITIPNTIISIGNNAFAGCDGLVEVSVEATTIPAAGSNMFSTAELKAIYVPNTLVNNYKSASGWVTYKNYITAFGSEGVTYVPVDSNYNQVEETSQNFYGYKVAGYTGSDTAIYLKTIYNGKPVVAIGESALKNTAISSVIVPENLESVMAEAFYGCVKLTSIQLPNTVKSIGSGAFSKTNITSISIPAEVKTIGTNPFTYCNNLTSISVAQANTVYKSTNNCLILMSNNSVIAGCKNSALEGTNAAVIAAEAFKGITELRSISIPSGITTIGSYAFAETGLTGANIPASVTTISEGAFKDNLNLLTLTVLNPSVATLGTNALSGASKLIVIYVPNNCVTAYRQATNWKAYKDIIMPVGSEHIVYSPITTLGASTTEGASDHVAYKVISYTGSDTEVFIKTLHNLKPVTVIGDYVFSSQTAITSINLPENLQIIGNSAFSGCSGLIGNLKLPNSVTSIGDYAFSGCSKLNGTLTLSSSLQTIGNNAFHGCSGLTGSLIIPNSVVTIGNSAFNDCSGLNGTLTLSSNLQTIGYNAFIATNLTGALTIPNSVISLGDSAFYQCDFTSLTLGSNLQTIGNSAFYNCLGLTGSLNIPNSVAIIGDSSFYRCNFTSLTLGSGLQTIGSYAFKECKELTGSLAIPNSVISIGDSAFDTCYNLTSLTLGSNLQTIGTYAFKDCAGFTGSLVIPNSVTNIDYGAFMWCTGFNGTLTLSLNLITIEEAVFAACGFTGNLQIPDNVQTIKDSAFTSLSITNLQFGSALKTIGSSAFSGCKNLTGTLAIPNNVNSVGEQAFESCSSITNITFSTSLQTISDYTFANCAGLTTLNIPSNIKTIGKSAFSNCSNLTTVTLKSGLVTIGESAFSKCSKITDIAIPNTLTTIGKSAFAETGLTDFTIPSSVTSIGLTAFSGCTSLTEVTIERRVNSGITTAGNNLFASCANLAIIWVPTEADALAYSAASGWSTYKDIIYPLDGAEGGTAGLNFVPIDANGKLEGDTGFNANKIVAYSVGKDINKQAYDGDALTDIVIPSVYNGKPVIQIGEGAFALKENIKTIKIKYGVKKIGNSAFFGTSSFDLLDLPASINEMSEAFILKIGKIKTIKMDIQNEYYRVETNSLIDIANGVILAGGDDALIPTDPTITKIGSYAYSLYNGTTLTIPSNIKTIYTYAFMDSDNLTSVNLGAVEQIYGYAFQSCSKLETVTMSNSLTYIGSRAFSYCKALTTITLPASLTEIEDEAFEMCYALETVYVQGTAPAAAGNIIFDDCSNLRAIFVPDYTGPTYRAANGWSTYADIIFAVSELAELTYEYNSSSNGYVVTSVSNDTRKTIVFVPATYNDGTHGTLPVVAIGDNAANGREVLTRIILPDTITTIGKYAFTRCSKVKQITMSQNVTIIDDYAFLGCGITSISLPSTLKFIGYSAFGGSALNSVYIPASVETIEGSAFSSISKLRVVEFGGMPTTIENLVFYQSSNLAVIYVPDAQVNNFKAHSSFSATEIGLITPVSTKEGTYGINYVPVTSAGAETTEGAADHVGYMVKGYSGSSTAVNIPAIYNLKPVTKIATWAFGSNIKSLNIPCTVKTLTAWNLENCTGLQQVIVYGGGLTTIEVEAFKNCTNLTMVHLPEGLKTVGNWAFNYCGSLTNVVIPSTVTQIGEWAFGNCSKLKTVVMLSGPSVGGYFLGDKAALQHVYVPESARDTLRDYVDNYKVYYNKLYEYRTGTSGLTYSYDSTSGSYTVADYTGSSKAVVVPMVYDDGVNGYRLVRKIGASAFAYDSNIQSMLLSDFIYEIDGYAFLYCTNMQQIHLPYYLETIGNNAFESSGIKSVVIPANVSSIERNAFYDCPNLANILFASDDPSLVSNSGINLTQTFVSIPYRCFWSGGTYSEWNEALRSCTNYSSWNGKGGGFNVDAWGLELYEDSWWDGGQTVDQYNIKTGTAYDATTFIIIYDPIIQAYAAASASITQTASEAEQAIGEAAENLETALPVEKFEEVA